MPLPDRPEGKRFAGANAARWAGRLTAARWWTRISVTRCGAKGVVGLADESGRPQAKDGGVFAGIAMLIREVCSLITAAGGVVVVIIGVGAVATIASASLGTVPDGEKATVAAAAFSVLGTIVGAYFGLRVGSQGKEEAEQGRRLATAKVERLAAELPPEAANRALREAESAGDEGASAKRKGV